MELERTIFSVYARPDENNRVIKIFSTCFEQPLDTDILLKSGNGDEFVHVQGDYQLLNTDGTHRYCIDNEAMRECTEEELEEERATFPKPQSSAEAVLANLLEQLATTDEIIISLYENQMAQEAVNNAQDDALIDIYEHIYV